MGKVKLTEQDKLTITQMLDQGSTQKAVAAHLGITASLVSYYANRGTKGAHGGARRGAGRQRLPAGQKRDKTVSIRFSASQLARLKAKAGNVDLSTWLYDAIIGAIGE